MCAALVASPVSLDDKWLVEDGRVFMNGTQALVRVLLAQRTLDRRAGLATAGYVTGYRGSPLGNVDTTLWSIAQRLQSADIVFQPALNEDIAATAVRGTQQVAELGDARVDGVFAAWYGKGPGIDRSGDALKHGNIAGTHRLGGVLVFYGDDHAGKSSTVAHHSEQAVAASLIPSLYPANVQEVLDFGLLGIALSRYSGSWVGVKCVGDVAEQSATVTLNLSAFAPVVPPTLGPEPSGLHLHHGGFNPLRDEQIVIEHRLPRVQAFVRANAIDREVFRAVNPALAVVTAGKAYGEVRSALALLGLDETAAAAAGISLYKVGCIWPLEPIGITEFVDGHPIVLVVEEKQSFLEQQLAAVLINRASRPLVLGKVDEQGAPLLPLTAPLDAGLVAQAILGRLEGLKRPLEFIAEDAPDPVPASGGGTGLKRTPYFCSGCPHNRSTRIPEGSLSMTGIGCHTMASFHRPAEALLPTQMGGEGGNWLGLAPFTRTRHIFQNMGDGTYYHSGLLAIRAAVAAGVNITYKILYNDAVAMTGGQPVDGPISVASIARQVAAEGIGVIYVLSEDPARHAAALPPGVLLRHRDALEEVQRTLRDTPGCTVLIYEQTCAAEKRRRRKRGTYPDPPKRVFIAKEVCEGCGDCSDQSTCVSLLPVDTDFGRKRAIDQSSCNKDFSCVNGFCPSFVTVYGAAPRKPAAIGLDERLLRELPTPPRAEVAGGSANLMIAGIGGTGVITVGALLGMAAHIDGLAASVVDMTGLSQKNGAVYTHVRIASGPSSLHALRLAAGEADVLLAFDAIAALAPESAISLRAGRTRAVVNGDVAPTVAFQFDRNAAADPAPLVARLRDHLGEPAVTVVDAAAIARCVLGDTIGANLFMLGIAAQRGWLPVSLAALDTAIALNGVAVSFNQRAFGLGRLWVIDPARALGAAVLAGTGNGAAAAAISLDDLIAHRAAHLTDYQGPALAARYESIVARVRAAEAVTVPGTDALTRAVAVNLAKVLAYKDEYEVARLLTSPALHAEITRAFDDGGRIAFNLAPPFMGGAAAGRPRKREFGRWMLPVLSLLKHGKALRGSPFDPFGRSEERRMERQLIADYEALIERVLGSLTLDNHTAAVTMLGLVDQVRGYGPVKVAAVQRYREQLLAAPDGG